jgi:hypothetical protein
MESLQINLNVAGEEIAFLYHQDMVNDLYSAVITDECSTIEEHLIAHSVDACLDELVPFLGQLGNVVSITSVEPDCPSIIKLQQKLDKLAG